MKTDTRERILKMVEKSGEIQPKDIHGALHITPQAVHRHLKALKAAGFIEVRGAGPQARYRVTELPDFSGAAQWVNSLARTAGSSEFYCESRSTFSGRLAHLQAFVRQGLPTEVLPLVISTAGEVGNNSFDHNLGQWRDIPGCWFEARVTGKKLWIWIADRGQGIFQSLASVHPEITSEQGALQTAFEKIISGRAPEQRGNGLKYVKKSLSEIPESGIACHSGAAHVSYGTEGLKCNDILERFVGNVQGTVTLMVWKLQ